VNVQAQVQVKIQVNVQVKIQANRQAVHFMSTTGFRRLLAREEGATAIEYCLIAAGIAGAIIVIVGTLGGKVGFMWSAVAAALG
jgi:Flp pilus assembly pilin Flp